MTAGQVPVLFLSYCSNFPMLTYMYSIVETDLMRLSVYIYPQYYGTSAKKNRFNLSVFSLPRRL